ncbi:MAG: THxN family PEP-CTERM protein [Rhodospirillaceae bacterium]
MSFKAIRTSFAAAVAALVTTAALVSAPRTAEAVTFTIHDVTYEWTGTTGGDAGNIVERTVGNREEVRWGVPFQGDPNSIDNRSGLGIEPDFGVFGALPFNVTENQNFPLGKLTHFNLPLQLGPIPSSAFLDVSVQIEVDSQTINAGPFMFRFDIEETFNQAPCPAFQISGTVCDDRITPFTAAPQTFSFDSQEFTITITGFCVTCNGGDPLPTFITEEGGLRSAFLIAQITVVDRPPQAGEPATLLGFGFGLAGLALVVRRRRR